MSTDWFRFALRGSLCLYFILIGPRPFAGFVLSLLDNELSVCVASGEKASGTLNEA